MQVHNARLKVTGSGRLTTPLEIAATIYLPNPKTLSTPPILMCALPGAGLSSPHWILSARATAPFQTNLW